jgi:transposase
VAATKLAWSAICGSVVGYLRDKGFTVLVLQPIQVKAYARVHLRRAKNDKLDAALIAACAATIDRARVAPDDRLAKLAHHLTFVEQIEEDIARFKIRLEHVGDPRLRRMVVADIARLKARRSAELLRIVITSRIFRTFGNDGFFVQ